MLTLAAVYLGGGLFYNVKRLGMPLEKESLPHYVFWTEFLPELVREVILCHSPGPVATAHLFAGHHVHHSHRQGVIRCAAARSIRPVIVHRALALAFAAMSQRAGIQHSVCRQRRIFHRVYLSRVARSFSAASQLSSPRSALYPCVVLSLAHFNKATRCNSQADCVSSCSRTATARATRMRSPLLSPVCHVSHLELTALQVCTKSLMRPPPTLGLELHDSSHSRSKV